jgi:hypothetical protein
VGHGLLVSTANIFSENSDSSNQEALSYLPFAQKEADIFKL